MIASERTDVIVCQANWPQVDVADRCVEHHEMGMSLEMLEFVLVKHLWTGTLWVE